MEVHIKFWDVFLFDHYKQPKTDRENMCPSIEVRYEDSPQTMYELLSQIRKISGFFLLWFSWSILTLSNAKTPYLALLGKVFLGKA